MNWTYSREKSTQIILGKNVDQNLHENKAAPFWDSAGDEHGVVARAGPDREILFKQAIIGKRKRDYHSSSQ
jgi:hypothetical protein